MCHLKHQFPFKTKNWGKNIRLFAFVTFQDYTSLKPRSKYRMRSFFSDKTSNVKLWVKTAHSFFHINFQICLPIQNFKLPANVAPDGAEKGQTMARKGESADPITSYIIEWSRWCLIFCTWGRIMGLHFRLSGSYPFGTYVVVCHLCLPLMRWVCIFVRPCMVVCCFIIYITFHLKIHVPGRDKNHNVLHTQFLHPPTAPINRFVSSVTQHHYTI